MGQFFFSRIEFSGRITRRIILFVGVGCLIGMSSINSSLGFQDKVVDEPLPPMEAARSMQVPDGFHVSLFAGEPAVKQPISFCIDDRGRLWVAEAYNYPVHGTGTGDRILIFEDTDLDGEYDKRTLFYDKLNYVTGVEVGFGGVWVMSPPNFYFIPDRDGDDRPDAEPEVLLDGFGNHANAHNLANGFSWGPDGWLYGTHGRTNWSLLGKPGTPDDERVRFDGGVYRYHPVTHQWEPYADGTTNPWGIDWDDYGQGFVCNCVNPHLFHVIQGAHYEPWRNRESSRYAFSRIPTIADHLHFVGLGNIRDGIGSHEEDTAGGGHAHCGTMVYLGASWPEQYRNSVFMNNIHGRRVNHDILQREGSGYVASHGADLMRSQDDWFMGVTIQYGPDGGVFVSDWSDTGECHSVRNTRRHTGRIFKISYGDETRSIIDLQSTSDQQLVELQLHRNDWYVRHARRLLQERMARGDDMESVHRSLYLLFEKQESVPQKLRTLWALHATRGLSDAFLIEQLGHPSEYVRAWSVRLLGEDRSVSSQAMKRFVELARDGDSPFVRLHLASLLQRLPLNQRWDLVEGLAGRLEDSNDANLPRMVWYGMEPLVNDNLARFVQLAKRAEIEMLQRHVARRVTVASDFEPGLALLVSLFKHPMDETRQRELLSGILQGFEGRRSVPMPTDWPTVFVKMNASENSEVRQQAVRLALVFNDQDALKLLRAQANDQTMLAEDRIVAIDSLVAKKVDGFATDLLQLVEQSIEQPDVCSAALRGLSEYQHQDTPSTLIAKYSTFDPINRQNAIQTLASRVEWAGRLMDAVEEKKIDRTELTAFTARQLRNLGDEKLIDRVHALWGDVRATSAEKTKLIANYRKRLSADALAGADHRRGSQTLRKALRQLPPAFW